MRARLLRELDETEKFQQTHLLARKPAESQLPVTRHSCQQVPFGHRRHWAGAPGVRRFQARRAALRPSARHHHDLALRVRLWSRSDSGTSLRLTERGAVRWVVLARPSLATNREKLAARR